MFLSFFGSFLLLLLLFEVVFDDIDVLSFGAGILLWYLPALIFFRVPCCLAFASLVDDLPDCIKVKRSKRQRNVPIDTALQARQTYRMILQTSLESVCASR